MIVRALIVFFITAYLDYTLIALDVFSLHGMIMFFVVPGGALILGAAFGFAIYDSHLKTQTPAHNKRTIMLGTFLGFMIIPAVLMLQFATARMDSSGQMYYALSGDHISNYSYKGKPIDLFNFLSLLEDTTSITLSFKGSNNSIELEPDPWQYRLFTLYEMAACAGAAYYVLQRFLRKSPFCDSCQKYHKGLRVTEIPTDAWEKESWVIRNCIKERHALPTGNNVCPG